jgi:protein SCO1/2
VIRSALLPLALSAATALAGCARAEDRAHEDPIVAPEAANAPESKAAPALLPATGPSLYELDLTLVDQDGRTLKLDAFAGRPVVVTMFYASCPVACPVLISDLKNAVRRASSESQKEVAVLLVSLDPERDTTTALKELATRHHRDLPNWRFTHTSAESTRELAAVLGIKYKKLEGGAIRHTSLMSVLDGRGVVRHRAQSPLPATDASLPLALDEVARQLRQGPVNIR